MVQVFVMVAIGPTPVVVVTSDWGYKSNSSNYFWALGLEIGKRLG